MCSSENPCAEVWSRPPQRALERRGVITTDPAERDKCCGIERDADGFCRHRPYHPIYVQRSN